MNILSFNTMTAVKGVQFDPGPFLPQNEQQHPTETWYYSTTGTTPNSQIGTINSSDSYPFHRSFHVYLRFNFNVRTISQAHFSEASPASQTTIIIARNHCHWLIEILSTSTTFQRCHSCFYNTWAWMISRMTTNCLWIRKHQVGCS